MKLLSTIWQRHGSSIVLVGMLATVPAADPRCDGSGNDTIDREITIQLEYHRQGEFAWDPYSAFPAGSTPLRSQLEDMSIKLELVFSDSVLPRQFLEGDPEFLWEYAQVRAEKNYFGSIKQKRQLFTVRGFYYPGTVTVSCENPGITAMPNPPNYSDFWASFVACGDKYECYPSADSLYRVELIEHATIHELGHLASAEIPECYDNQTWHNSVCVMYSTAPDNHWPVSEHSELVCYEGGMHYPMTYDYCNSCRESIRRQRNNWPQ